MAASTPWRRTGWRVISAASSGLAMASRMVPSPRMARYSGSDRPAWRMNHTGGYGVGSPRHAARNGASAGAVIAVDVTSPRRRVRVRASRLDEGPDDGQL